VRLEVRAGLSLGIYPLSQGAGFLFLYIKGLLDGVPETPDDVIKPTHRVNRSGVKGVSGYRIKTRKFWAVGEILSRLVCTQESSESNRHGPPEERSSNSRKPLCKVAILVKIQASPPILMGSSSNLLRQLLTFYYSLGNIIKTIIGNLGGNPSVPSILTGLIV